MLSLSVPRLTSLAPNSTFTSHRRHFLQRKPLSVSIPATISKPSLPISSFKPSHISRRFQLAVKADSLEPEEELEEAEGEVGEVEEEAEGGALEVVEEEGDGDDKIYGFLEGEEEGEEEEEEEYDEEEEENMRAQMVLKFIWMEKNIGLALERLIPGGKGSIPLTPYYFWPRKDAWEELKAVLEEKGWVSQKRMIILLNQATDIINLWQQSGAPTV